MTTALKPGGKGKGKHPFYYQYDAVSDVRELLWRCSKCGELIHRKEGLPERCPSCSAPRQDFALVEED